MDKTVVLAVTRRIAHSRYNKVVKRTTKYKAHDEKNECKVGDMVRVIETRPISKDKRWRSWRSVKRRTDFLKSNFKWRREGTRP